MSGVQRLLISGLLTLFLLSVAQVFGDTAYDPLGLPKAEVNVPDNSSVRKEYRQIILSGFHTAYHMPAEILVDKTSGRRVKFRVAKQRDSFYLIFVNELEYKFPLYSRGTYIIRKNISDGRITQVKVFIHSHEGCAVKIVPRGSSSSLSLLMYGRKLYEDVPVPVDIETVSFLPFYKIIRLTERIIDWDLIFPEIPEYNNNITLEMIRTVRNALQGLDEGPDGALDEEGRFVFIESLEPQPEDGLNCSGFAKWVADGLYFPRTGRYMDIKALKKRNTGIRGHRWSDRYETQRDPYFGLDWTRNIAAELYSVIRKKDVPPDYADVREVPFFTYVDDMGYPVHHARLIFFFLNNLEPGYFYLASINKDVGEDVKLRQHYHVAVFFPYYTGAGEFRVAVFERTKETELVDFVSDYSESAMHLVRLPVSRKFVPPTLNIQND
jgi:hypothetical protein